MTRSPHRPLRHLPWQTTALFLLLSACATASGSPAAPSSSDPPPSQPTPTGESLRPPKALDLRYAHVLAVVVQDLGDGLYR